MRYRFDMDLTDEDYYNFNVFMQTKTESGKRNILISRILCIIFTMILAFMIWLTGILGDKPILFLVLVVINGIIFQIKYISLLKNKIRKTISMYKKQGKFTYSAKSVIEFDEERIYETTEESKIEQTLSNAEYVSVCESDKAIYIRINAAMTFVMPYRVFESDEQREEFVEFLRTKCKKVYVISKI